MRINLKTFVNRKNLFKNFTKSRIKLKKYNDSRDQFYNLLVKYILPSFNIIIVVLR